MIKDLETDKILLVEFYDHRLVKRKPGDPLPERCSLHVFDLSSIIEQDCKKQDCLVMRGQLSIEDLGIEAGGIDLHFDFDYYHRILVVYHDNSYFVALGTEASTDIRAEYESWLGHSKAIDLNFSVEKASILDNQIKSARLKNMRLYLLDADYSMVVFTIVITE